MNIYIGNLAYSVTESQLTEAFKKFGEVVSTNIVTDKFSGQAKGFAFVEMSNKEDGIKAIAGLNGTRINDREIKVNEAKPRENRPRTGGGNNRW
ncbi:MAG: RNA-binding protein [Spirochaetia bacterium]|nr:RNA-binding protein [Spirochaetia bacterium]